VFRKSRQQPPAVSDSEGMPEAEEPVPHQSEASGDSRYAELAGRIAGVLEAAQSTSDQLVAEAREEAKRLRREAAGDAEQIRASAEADAAKTRQEAEELASVRQREADEQAQAALQEAESQAEATREASAEMARELANEVRKQKEAAARQATLAAGARDVEEWLEDTLQDLKEMVRFVEETLDQGGEENDHAEPAEPERSVDETAPAAGST
jgi:hypothetical protein